jgi:uncharacterized membrane protein YfcA
VKSVASPSAKEPPAMTLLVHYLISLVIGAAAGFLGGIFGITGGSIAIAAMALLGHSQQVAQGTSLVMQLPNLLLGAWQYTRRGNLDVRAALLLSGSALPFSYAGAVTATHLPSRELRIAFGVFFMLLATYALWNAVRKPRRVAALSLRSPYLPALGALAGYATGLFGIGGPALATPSLVLFFGTAQTVAQGMSLFLAAPGNVVGLVTYAVAHDVDWGAGIALALGAGALVGVGVAAAHRLPEKILRVLFAGFVYTVASLLLIEAR